MQRRGETALSLRQTRPTHGPLTATMGEEPPTAAGWEDVEPPGRHRDGTRQVWQRRQPLRALEHVAGNSNNNFDRSPDRGAAMEAGNPGHVIYSPSRGSTGHYFEVGRQRWRSVAFARSVFSFQQKLVRRRVADRPKKHMNGTNVQTLLKAREEIRNL